MKILSIFNRYLETGGEARAVEVIYESLAHIAEVHSCEFSSAEWTGPKAPTVLQQAVRMINNQESVRRLQQRQREHGAEGWLVHNVFPVGSAGVYREAQRQGIPVLQYLHNFRPFSVNGYLWADGHLVPDGLRGNYWPEIRAGAWQDSRVKTAWFAFVLSLSWRLGWWRSIKAWIAISDFMREKFIAAGVPAEDIFTLRHFWSPRAEGFPEEGQHYLFLGRLNEAKGIEVLLRAWEILEEKLGDGAPALLIGGDGPLRAEVTARAERMRSVKFAGELRGAEKEDALRTSRALIVPSVWWEGLGLVVYEAFEHSRPVLVARSGGLPENVIEGETGLLHQPGNAEELAAQVIELDHQPTRRRKMGMAGRRWLEENRNELDWRQRMTAILAKTVRG